MASWRPARGIVKFRAQLDDLAPRRSKASDGTIGDAAHQKAGTSQHLPKEFPWADIPIVLATDITNDPVGGLDCQKLYLALMDGRDQRMRYVIWQRKITSGAGGPNPWVARSYTGPSPHDHHLHLSLVGDARADVAIPWVLRMNVPDAGSAVKPSPTQRLPELRYGQRSTAVKRLQAFLASTFPSYADIEADGVFGEKTRLAVKEFQRRAGVHGSPLDGTVVGSATNFALAEYGYRG